MTYAIPGNTPPIADSWYIKKHLFQYLKDHFPVLLNLVVRLRSTESAFIEPIRPLDH